MWKRTGKTDSVTPLLDGEEGGGEPISLGPGRPLTGASSNPGQPTARLSPTRFADLASDNFNQNHHSCVQVRLTILVFCLLIPTVHLPPPPPPPRDAQSTILRSGKQTSTPRDIVNTSCRLPSQLTTSDEIISDLVHISYWAAPTCTKFWRVSLQSVGTQSSCEQQCLKIAGASDVHRCPTVATAAMDYEAPGCHVRRLRSQRARCDQSIYSELQYATVLCVKQT